MPTRPNRKTVNLSQFPDLVVIYLGIRVNTVTGIKTLLGFGPKISASVEARPDGLLLHESVFYSLRHVGMRQYWRDFESLEQWSRSEPHRTWWQTYLRDTGGTGFWHETYLRRGGVEAVYVDMKTDRNGSVCTVRAGAGSNVLGPQTRRSYRFRWSRRRCERVGVGLDLSPDAQRSGVFVNIAPCRHVFDPEPERLEKRDVFGRLSCARSMG